MKRYTLESCDVIVVVTECSYAADRFSTRKLQWLLPTAVPSFYLKLTSSTLCLRKVALRLLMPSRISFPRHVSYGTLARRGS